MLNKHKHRIIIMVCALAYTWGMQHEACAEEKQVVVTKQMVLDLLPQNDLWDENDRVNFTKLIAMGSDAYPAISQLLDNTEDPYMISTLYAIFRKSRADNKMAVAAIRRTLNRFSGKDQRSISIQFGSIQALGDLGDIEDADILLEFLDNENELIRASALRALGQIGNTETINRIEEVQNKRGANLNEEEKRRDYSFAEGVKAIEMIKIRISTDEKKK